MLRRLRHRGPSHATVVAYVALFVALGGTTYAAATIGAGDIKDDAVRSNHIKNGEVGNGDLAPDSVGTGKVIDGSLLAQDFKPGQIPAGPKGDKGDRGPPGANGGTHVVARWGTAQRLGPEEWKSATVKCHRGERAVSGGAHHDGGNLLIMDVLSEGPLITAGKSVPFGWFADVRNRGHQNEHYGNIRVRAFAICAAT